MMKPLLSIFLPLGILCASCSRSESTMTGSIQPNAKRDLVVKQSSNKQIGDRKSNTSKAKESIQFYITNRSESFTYNRIYLALYFRDQKGRLIDSTRQRFSIRVKPGQTKQVSYDRSTLKYPATKSTVALVSTADHD